ncbi:hypothetical protein IC615_07950 [Serratia ureilytica]
MSTLTILALSSLIVPREPPSSPVTASHGAAEQNKTGRTARTQISTIDSAIAHPFNTVEEEVYRHDRSQVKTFTLADKSGRRDIIAGRIFISRNGIYWKSKILSNY